MGVTALAPATFALGERIPHEAFAPADAGELASLLRACDERGRAVVFFGGNTLQTLGRAPSRYDVALSLERLDRIVEYEPGDSTVAVQGGVGVAALDAALAEHGQFVPFDVPRASSATVGGSLAAGWLGPRRAAYGSPRDLLIGTTVALADGTLAKAGGMVVKNSTGYDLSKLYFGSLGTLGAIVRANLRTLPLPGLRRIALAAMPEGTRGRALAHVRALESEPVAALAVHGFEREVDGREGADGRLFLLYEGSERRVERAIRDLRSALGAAGVPETRLVDRDANVTFAHALDAYVASLGARSATYRSAGSPANAADRLATFRRLAAHAQLQAETIEDMRTGDVVARLSARLPARFAERIVAFEEARRDVLAGARVLVAPPASAAQLDVWGAPPPRAFAQMRALKERFDPSAILAPGRFVGGL